MHYIVLIDTLFEYWWMFTRNETMIVDVLYTVFEYCLPANRPRLSLCCYAIVTLSFSAFLLLQFSILLFLPFPHRPSWRSPFFISSFPRI
jgi:hypothetical protein